MDPSKQTPLPASRASLPPLNLWNSNYREGSFPGGPYDEDGVLPMTPQASPISTGRPRVKPLHPPLQRERDDKRRDSEILNRFNYSSRRSSASVDSPGSASTLLSPMSGALSNMSLSPSMFARNTAALLEGVTEPGVAATLASPRRRSSQPAGAAANTKSGRPKNATVLYVTPVAYTPRRVSEAPSHKSTDSASSSSSSFDSFPPILVKPRQAGRAHFFMTPKFENGTPRNSIGGSKVARPPKTAVVAEKACNSAPRHPPFTVIAHASYVRHDLPMVAMVMRSGHVGDWDTIELPMPFLEAWPQVMSRLYSGEGAMTDAMRQNILHLGGNPYLWWGR